jgi:flavorubredoxin
MSFTIKENISWVGKIDWELRKFHGEEYSTHWGSSYNSYLVRDKKAAAFGCYGWSGEAVRIISSQLKECGFELLNDGLRAQWNPDNDAIRQAINLGKEIGQQLKG